MSKLEKAYYTITEMEIKHAESPSFIDARIIVLTTLIYLIMMLSVPMGRLATLLLYAAYPIIATGVLGIGYGHILKNSLYILPLIVVIVIFNPILDKTPIFKVYGVTITTGWISFVTVIIRGVLAMQAILILIDSCGFRGVCRALKKIGIPSFLTDQLMFVYRYISVLLIEALTMRRAREARGYGRKSYPIKLWGTFTGQLFLRAIDRSERINRAMLARGFNGNLPDFQQQKDKIGAGSIVYFILMGGIWIALRFIDITPYLAGLAI